MPNIGSVISQHNKVLLSRANQNSPSTTKTCNCRNKDAYPLAGKCLTKSLVYQATVKREDSTKQETYIGLTENSFKPQYSNHVSSFRNANKKHATELSKYIWQLKDLNVRYSISWKIIKQCKPYSKNTKRCNLCLHEKFLIICHPELSTVNSRNELVSICRHRRKNLLSKH